VATAQTRPATAPATQPAHVPVVWHCTTQPAAGADGSEAKPMPLTAAVAKLRDGDTLALHGGETFPAIMLAKLNGGRITSYGDRWATVDAQYPILLSRVSGTWDIGNVHVLDSSRDPSRVGFKPHAGGMGIAVRDSDAQVTIHDFTADYTAIGVDVESVNQKGLVVRDGIIRTCYGIDQRSQGLFLTGQLNASLNRLYVAACGWYPGLQAANTQDHGLYAHWTDTSGSGPIYVGDCTFIDCAAAGPTTNSGGTFDGCIVIDCAHDGFGMNLWGSRDNWTMTGCSVIGGFANAIAKNCTVDGNVFVNCPGFAINVDVPAQTVNWRTPTNNVIVRNNVSFGSTGDCVRVTNAGGGHVEKTNNVTMPSGYAMDQVIRAAAAGRLAELQDGMK